MDIKTEIGAEDVFTKETHLVCLADGIDQAFLSENVFATDVDIAFTRPRRHRRRWSSLQ